MDRDRCMEIMEGYGVGPNMMRLIRTFWDEQKLVCRAAKRYGEPFKASRGVTQGGPLSPKIFNIMVDAIVREWIRQLLYTGREEETELSDSVAEVLNTLSIILALLYADDAYIASTSQQVVQDSMDILTELFDRVGLRTNTEKTKVMTCVNEKVQVRRSEEVYRNTTAGFHTEKDWRNRRVTCDHCGLEMSAKSLPGHLESQHGIYRSRVIDRDLVLDDRESITYAAMQSPSGAWDCPVPDCPGSVQTPWNLRRHFRDRHPLDFVNVPGEGVLPKCPRCDMQTNFANSPNHERSKMCREGAERKAQYAAAAANARALEVEFTAYGETLERVEVFKYLGRLMAMDDNDMHAVRHNLKKARGVWKRFSVLLHRENLPPRVCGMFYKAVIQSVLLYGSETWSLSDSSMRRLEGFHFLAACRMARVNRPRRVQRDGTCQWSYPSKDDVYEEVGLFPIRHYIEVRRQTVAAYIVNRPIFDRCVDAERPRGSSYHLFWWEQPVDLNLARGGEQSSPGVAADDFSRGRRSGRRSE